jgi:pimeloyl-ACP methyl ester carboxylesterase
MLHYSSNGSGQPIVLLHGFCENSTCFNEQVFLLKGHYRIICIDLPGHGLSTEQSDFGMEEIANQVNDVLDACGIQQCVMIGHSMGGYVTLAFAQKYAHRLKGYGLLHSTANADSAERKNKRDQAIGLINQKGAAFYVEQFIPPLYAAGTDSALIKARQTSNLGISSTTLIACLTAMKNRLDNNSLLASSKLPVSFIAGGNDAIIPMHDMLAQAASVPVGQVTCLPEAAHMGMLEKPQEVAKAISNFALFCFGA